MKTSLQYFSKTAILLKYPQFLPGEKISNWV